MRYAISYVSTAKSTLTKKQIQKMLNWTQKWNNDHQINGILLYSEGNFFQVLEGEKKDLLAIFTNILADKRHYNIIKLFEKEVANFSFDKYKTAFIALDYRYPATDVNMYFSQIELLNPNIQNSVRYILNKFTEGIK